MVRAFETYSQGEVATARKQLEDVRQVLSGEDEYLQQFLGDTIIRWNEDQWIQGRRRLLAEIIRDAHADADASLSGADTTARLAAAISLYADDDAVRDEVEECRQLLAERQMSASEQQVDTPEADEVHE